jgi:hypothetical protein
VPDTEANGASSFDVRTVEMWVRVPKFYASADDDDEDEDAKPVFEERGHCLLQTPRMSLFLKKHAALAIELHDLDSQEVYLRDVFAGAWVHLAVTLDTDDNTLCVYQNGKLQHLSILGKAAIAWKKSVKEDLHKEPNANRAELSGYKSISSNAAFRIGSNTTDASYALLGHLSEFRAWATVRDFFSRHVFTSVLSRDALVRFQ